ncbi:hypothetical protein [Streptosporangium sp. NPDC000396]|uniref:hypothetical protein n=1 Tax=Streptosporangium sp. NPDC000396 TaxID=3366185 RepID=UPI0036A96C34
MLRDWMGSWRFRRQPLHDNKFNAMLPSALPGLYFNAEFSLSWKSLSQLPVAAAGSLAIGRAQDAAEQVSERFSVIRLRDAQNRVNSELGRIVHVVSDGVRLEGASVLLRVNEETERVAASHERRMRAGLLVASDLDASIDRVTEFREEVVRNPGSALAYWFMRYPEQLDRNGYNNVIALVEKIAEYDEKSMWIRLAQITQKFVQDLRDKEKQDLLKVLELLFETYGQHRQATEVAQILEELLQRSHPPAGEPGGG